MIEKKGGEMEKEDECVSFEPTKGEKKQKKRRIGDVTFV